MTDVPANSSDNSGFTPSEPGTEKSKDNIKTGSDSGETELITVEIAQAEQWQTVASFSIEVCADQTQDAPLYQMTAHHMETEETKIWPDIRTDKLQAWLYEQLVDTVLTDSASNLTTQSSSEGTRQHWFKPLIKCLHIYQPSDSQQCQGTTRPNQIFPSSVKGNMPFTLEMEFSIEEKEQFANVDADIFYKAECCARPLNQSEVLPLGSISFTPLFKKNDIHIAHFPEIELEPGLFCLQILLKIHGVNALPAFIQIPSLQVI